jgi:hypothetical protein
MTDNARGDALQAVLARFANERRQAATVYANAQEHVGTAGVPRRLISDHGFPAFTQFTYLNPHSSHITRNTEPRTPIQLVTLHPYGLTADRAILVSTRATERRITNHQGAGNRGVSPLTEVVLVPAVHDANSVTAAKTETLLRRVTTRGPGPAFHAILPRNGDIIVCAALDDEVQAVPSIADVSINVALEGGLGIRRLDWEGHNYSQLVELPYTSSQLFSLHVLLAKIRTAVPNIPLSFLNGAPTHSMSGIAYMFPTDVQGAQQYNFTNDAWRGHSPLDHELSDNTAVIRGTQAVPPLDTATQVFIPPQTPPPRATRASIRPAIATVDTLGASSPLLAIYSSIAGTERSADMQTISRARFFVQRINGSQQDADNTGNQASTAQAVTQTHVPEPAVNSGPHVFDFTSGFWGDGEPW